MAEDMSNALEGWYADPDDESGNTVRFWTGTVWTDRRRAATPGEKAAGTAPVFAATASSVETQVSVQDPPAAAATTRDVLWALSLAFGAAGGIVGVLSVPLIAFFWPLGMGVAGLALALAAATTPGSAQPWYAIPAVLGSVAALLLGIAAYSDYSDAQDKLDQTQEQFQDLLD